MFIEYEWSLSCVVLDTLAIIKDGEGARSGKGARRASVYGVWRWREFSFRTCFIVNKIILGIPVVAQGVCAHRFLCPYTDCGPASSHWLASSSSSSSSMYLLVCFNFTLSCKRKLREDAMEGLRASKSVLHNKEGSLRVSRVEFVQPAARLWKDARWKG